jgi:hypothetical protein
LRTFFLKFAAKLRGRYEAYLRSASFFSVSNKKCILAKQMSIKNQRDKQIALFISLIINLLSRNKGINTPPR